MWQCEEAAACFEYFRIMGNPYSIWCYVVQDGENMKGNAGRDNAAGVATHYGMNGPGLKPWWGARPFLNTIPDELGAIPNPFIPLRFILVSSIHPDLSL